MPADPQSSSLGKQAPHGPPTLLSARVAPSIAGGDRAARRGDWPLAIGIWQSLLDGNQREAAAERIRWFLNETSSGRPETGSVPSHRRMTNLPLAVALGCGLIATALVLIAESASGPSGNFLAAAAWLMYIVSATLVVIHANRSGRSSIRMSGNLSSDDILRARQLADSVGKSNRGVTSPG